MTKQDIIDILEENSFKVYKYGQIVSFDEFRLVADEILSRQHDALNSKCPQCGNNHLKEIHCRECGNNYPLNKFISECDNDREKYIAFLSDYFGVDKLEDMDIEKIDDYITSIKINK